MSLHELSSQEWLEWLGGLQGLATRAYGEARRMYDLELYPAAELAQLTAAYKWRALRNIIEMDEGPHEADP